MSTQRHYWLALHPDIRKPIGGAKQMHRLAEALTRCGRQATLIQENADFHPGWFESTVKTIALADWRNRSDLDPRTDVVVLPETFLPALPGYGLGLPKLLFNQNGAYSFGFRDGDGFPDTAQAVLNLYDHSDLAHVLCVSKHDQQLLAQGFKLGLHRVSRLINAIETDTFRPGGSNKKRILSFMPRKNSRDASIVAALLRSQPWFAGWTLEAIHGLHRGRPTFRKPGLLSQASENWPPPADSRLRLCPDRIFRLGSRELMTMARSQQVGWEVEFGDWQTSSMRQKPVRSY